MRVGVSEITVAYNGRPVVVELSLQADAGSFVGLIGPNGAGKTTVLRAVAGLVGHAGRIELGDEKVADMPRRRLSQTIAFVPQRPHIPEAMAIVDYVLMGRTPYIAYLGSESRRDVDIARSILDRLDLTGLAQRPLGSLSGGEVQRAVLGRALAQEAPVLLLDEPTAALDVGHQQQVLELIDSLRLEHDLTVIAAMHDLTLAGQFCERLALVADGRIVASGSPEVVLTEETIRTHYDANVRVFCDGASVVVVPTRSDAAVSRGPA